MQRCSLVGDTLHDVTHCGQLKINYTCLSVSIKQNVVYIQKIRYGYWYTSKLHLNVYPISRQARR